MSALPRYIRDMLRYVVLLTLAACSSKPTDPAPSDAEAPLSDVRGDPTPPRWAELREPDLGAAALRSAFEQAAPELPQDLSERHVICKVSAGHDVHILDGERDLRMHWTVAERERIRWGNGNPSLLVFRLGEVATGTKVRVRVVDEDLVGKDDQLGSAEGVVAPGLFALRGPQFEALCRAMSHEALRRALAKPLADLRARITRIDPDFDPGDDVEDTRNESIGFRRFELSAFAALFGWDHPDVHPLRTQLDARLPTHRGRPESR